ncbi:YbaB/EbfC family nucleoid-associated protein [Candidatus Gracilibacteria bacterium]|nr:YbaB/EbfC family nucleoid-associated protein [Candidatus Gracilibacteria bacterium]
MGMFDKAKNLYQLQKQAKQIKNELKSIHIEAESDGVTVVMSGEQECVEMSISESAWQEFKNSEFGAKKLSQSTMKAFNKATKKAQEIGSAKMKGVWDQMGGAGA